jgi:hypothetical protein
MENGVSQKRKFKRYDVDSVHGRLLYSSDINILNISMDGAAIATSQRLAFDREYSLKLKFEDTFLVLKGKVVWSVLSHSKTQENGEVIPIYKAGIKFINILTDAASPLISYVEKGRAHSPEKRILGVRFRESLHEGSEIDLSCGYEIKRISLSGMLIETEAELACDSRQNMEINLNGKLINVVGRIANVAKTKTDGPERFETGIEFLEISEMAMGSLRAYIDAIEQKS